MYHPVLPMSSGSLLFRREIRPRHYLYSVTAIRGRDRNLSGVVLLLRDITRLREVERLKSEFVMATSHELRTPLTSLGMSIDLLMEHAGQELAAKDQDLLRAAHEEVHRMKDLVNDLLDLSRIEAGRIELKFEKYPGSDPVRLCSGFVQGPVGHEPGHAHPRGNRRSAPRSRGRQQDHLGADEPGVQCPPVCEQGRAYRAHGAEDRTASSRVGP